MPISGEISSRDHRWLLYDGDCGFCRRWCDWAIARGARQSINFEACQTARELRHQAGVPDEQCMRTAVYIECDRAGQVSQVRTGAAAINSVLANLPGSQNIFWRWLSRIYDVPIIRQIEEAGYQIVARWRGRLGTSACKLN
jgi:predicted DCC family thiol-disulfide oxidoreductase YuxK